MWTLRLSDEAAVTQSDPFTQRLVIGCKFSDKVLVKYAEAGSFVGGRGNSRSAHCTLVQTHCISSSQAMYGICTLDRGYGNALGPIVFKTHVIAQE